MQQIGTFMASNVNNLNDDVNLMSTGRAEINQQIRDIIKSPMRSQISTSDIAVGMWSSTALGEKVADLADLFDKALQLAVVSARADEIILICDETELFTKKRNKAVYNLYLPMAYLIQRVSELKKQKAELEGGNGNGKTTI